MTHPRNAPGEFYVEKDCCTLCGVPWTIAPELFESAPTCANPGTPEPQNLGTSPDP